MGGHPVRAWKARYAGTCPLCDRPIEPGEQVVRTGAGIVHNGGCLSRGIPRRGEPGGFRRPA